MQFDLSSVETATMVFVGTMVFALVMAAFVLTAGFLALVLVGAGRLAWFVVSTSLFAVVHGINRSWDKLVHQAGTVELPGDFQGQPSPSTGTYPRVMLGDS
jgi:bacteriorhodopsin